MPGTGVGTSTLLKSHPFVHVRFPGAWNKCGNLSILSGLHAVSCVASRDGVGALLAGVEGRTFLPRARRKKGMRGKGLSFSPQDFFLKEKKFLTAKSSRKNYV